MSEYVQTDDYQWILKLEEGRYRGIQVDPFPDGGVIASTAIYEASEWSIDEMTAAVEAYYGSLDEFTRQYPKDDPSQGLLIAEMMFETYLEDLDEFERVVRTDVALSDTTLSWAVDALKLG